MALARPTFLHMRVSDGTYSTTCTWCVRAITQGVPESELLEEGQVHECDFSDLRRFGPAAKASAKKPFAFGR